MNQNTIRIGLHHYKAIPNPLEFGQHGACEKCAGFRDRGALCNSLNSVAPCTRELRLDKREIYWVQVEPTVGQTRRMAMLESVVSTFVGLALAFIAQAILFRVYGVHVSSEVNALIVFWMTLLSLVRGYGLRRLFNWLHHR